MRRIHIGLTVLLCFCLAPAWAGPDLSETSAVPWLEQPQGSRMHRMKVPLFDAEVAVYEAGLQNERSVLLVHGLGRTASRIWAGTFAALAADFHVVAFDLPGFGASSKGNHPYNPAAYASIVKTVAEATISTDFMLVGHSMGGAISLSYAADAPETLKRLVLVDAAGVLHRSVYTGYLSRQGINILPVVFPQQGDWLSGLAQTVLGSLEALPLPANAVLHNASLRSKLLAADPLRIAALGLVLQDYNPILPQVVAPTLIIWGQNDPLAPLRTGRLLAGQLPQARLRILPGVAHNPMLEAPELFHKLLRQALDSSDAEFIASIAEARYALPRYAESSQHDVDCDASNRELVLEGNYRQVTVTGCDNVLIRNSHLASLQVHDARVEVENSHILGLGLRCNDSRIEVTGGSITGVNAVDCLDSELDLAGVEINGQQSALKGEDTLVYLSVSRLISPKGDRPMHEVLFLTDGREY